MLQELIPAPDAGGWSIERLGGGVQADIFVVRTRNRQPLWQAHSDLVVKVYKTAGPDLDEVVRDEFESLSRLNARLDGCIINGWTIHTPAPLLRCERPAGLVMTMVSGRSLNSYLQASDGATAEDLESLASTIIAALERYWRGESRIYGDIDFNNILFDPMARGVSFVDPGMPERAYLCEGVDQLWYPASRDLAYMLFDVAASVKSFIGHSAARRRQKKLVERVLRTSLERLDSVHEKTCLLDEVDACARVHLRRIKATWSPAGIWRLLLRQIVSRSIAQTIHRLRAVAVASGDTPRHGVVCWNDRGGPPCIIDRSP